MIDLSKIAKNLLFIDIETISATSSFDQLSERMQGFWSKKASYMHNPDGLDNASLYFERAGIYAEFGKIVVIGLGFFHWNDEQALCLKAKSLVGTDEKELLLTFKQLIERKYKPNELMLCAHNGKEFDYPYLCRRMLINGIDIPKALQLSGKKPWEILHLDTLEMWKFGDKKHYTSLDLLAEIFGIPSSKQTLSGDQVNQTFYSEGDIDKIARYCREDIVVLAQLFLKYNNLASVAENNIERIE